MIPGGKDSFQTPVSGTSTALSVAGQRSPGDTAADGAASLGTPAEDEPGT